MFGQPPCAGNVWRRLASAKDSVWLLHFSSEYAIILFVILRHTRRQSQPLSLNNTSRIEQKGCFKSPFFFCPKIFYYGKKVILFMYSLQAEASFDAAHFLAGHADKCRNLHGHRWLVRAELCAPDLQTAGTERSMLLDFANFKQTLKRLAADLDHKFIYERGSLQPSTIAALQAEGFALAEMPFRPTAEELARWFYQALTEHGLKPTRVWLYETPENCASYFEEGGV